MRRLAIGLVVLFGISAVAFSMAYLLPSDPVTSRYPDITNEQRAEMRRQMGLDQPLVVQYARYMESVFRGEFGRSFGTGNSVGQDLAQRIPATLELASFGIAFGVLVGIPLGLIAAVRRGKPTDHLVRLVNIAIQSVPAFWLGVVLIFLLYFQWRLVPSPIGRLSPMFISPPPVTGFLTIDALLAGAAIVETVFAWPGIGRYAVTAITTSDMAPVSTCILLIASSVAITNLLVDLSYALIDPRIRQEYAR